MERRKRTEKSDAGSGLKIKWSLENSKRLIQRG